MLTNKLYVLIELQYLYTYFLIMLHLSSLFKHPIIAQLFKDIVGEAGPLTYLCENCGIIQEGFLRFCLQMD